MVFRMRISCLECFRGGRRFVSPFELQCRQFVRAFFYQVNFLFVIRAPKVEFFVQPCIEVGFAPFSKNVKTAVSIGDFRVKKAICTGDFYEMRAMFPEKLHGWAKIIRPFVILYSLMKMENCLFANVFFFGLIQRDEPLGLVYFVDKLLRSRQVKFVFAGIDGLVVFRQSEFHGSVVLAGA